MIIWLTRIRNLSKIKKYLEILQFNILLETKVHLIDLKRVKVLPRVSTVL